MLKLRGKVKWFSEKKGYGFIVCDHFKRRDIFVHKMKIKSNLAAKPLQPGDTVEFNVVETKRGIQAENVVKVQA